MNFQPLTFSLFRFCDLSGFDKHVKSFATDMEADNRRLERGLFSRNVFCGYWEKVKQYGGEIPRVVLQKFYLFVEQYVFSRVLLLCAAIIMGKTEFVRELVEKMSEEELDINVFGKTAFYYAVAYGRQIECARIMLNKKPGLANTLLPSHSGIKYLPIEIADQMGLNDMVNFLYEHTDLGFGNIEYQHVDSFLTFIDHGSYGTASLMLSENPELATQFNSMGETALYAISGNETRRRMTVRIRRNDQLTEELLKQADGKADHLIKRALFRAAEKGNSEFLTTALRWKKDLGNKRYANNHTIFHVAVQHRHMDILHMMQEIMGDVFIHEEGNNILKLAAKLPLSGLEVVRGRPALQLLCELLFFEELKKVVGMQHMETEYEMRFNHEHEELRRRGEELLKKTAESCKQIVTIIFTLSFAGLFSVPGGYKQDTGIAVHHGKLWFEIFCIAIAFTFVSATSSTLFFQAILNSSFAVSEFQNSLPVKWLGGLASIIVSFLGTVIVLVAAFFVNFEHTNSYLCYLVAALGLWLMLLASCLHVPHLVQVFSSTYKRLYSRRNRIISEFVINTLSGGSAQGTP